MARQRRQWSDRRLALLVAAATLIKGLVWISLMPPFKVADEPTHFENVQFRGEHLAAPYVVDQTEPYGTTVHQGSPPDVQLVWKRSNELFRGRYVPGVRSIHEEDELKQMANDAATRRGTGRLTSASYPGFYYDSAVPIYLVFKKTSLLTRLTAVRCVSLGYGILAAVFTFLTARLVMRSRALAVAAAFVVMLEPMESQMGAAVNNDAGVIGLAAIMFYLQVRFLVRAPEVPPLRWAALLGLLAGGIVFTKPHGFAMLPGCAIVCAWLVAVNLRDRRAWLFAAVAAACAGGLILLSLLHLRDVGQTALLSGPPGAGGGAAAAAAPPQPTFLHFLTTMDDSYKKYLFRSFIGQFGWLEHSIDDIWLECVRTVWTIAEAGFVAAVAAAVMRLPGHRWLSMRGFLFAAYTAAFTVAFILFAEHRFRLLGIIGVIQGRNMLFGLPALAIVVAAGWGALLPARFRTLGAGALVTAAAGLHAGALMHIFRYYYGT